MKKLFLLLALFSASSWAVDYEFCAVDTRNGSVATCYDYLKGCETYLELYSKGSYICITREKKF
jgi:hypothetical protein